MKFKKGDRVAVHDHHGKYLWSGVVNDRPGTEWARVRSDISGEVRTLMVSRLRPEESK